MIAQLTSSAARLRCSFHQTSLTHSVSLLQSYQHGVGCVGWLYTRLLQQVTLPAERLVQTAPAQRHVQGARVALLHRRVPAAPQHLRSVPRVRRVLPRCVLSGAFATTR